MSFIRTRIASTDARDFWHSDTLIRIQRVIRHLGNLVN